MSEAIFEIGIASFTAGPGFGFAHPGYARFSTLRRPTEAALFDLDTSDFETAAFRALEAVEVALGGFGLDAE
jgi:hypothetical protein